MALAEELPPDASIASTGLSLRYIGSHVYAYGGVIGVVDSETILLGPSITGTGYITAKLQINYMSSTENNIEYLIYFNDVVVQGYTVKGGGNYTEADVPIWLIIPPFTNVKVTGENKSSSTPRNHAVSLTGRVYQA